MPCLLAVLATLPMLKTVIIDGYVWLDNASGLGLGGHLYQALGGRMEVVGVAKTKFCSAVEVCEVMRGKSTRPLYISAAGVEASVAAGRVRSMHGKYRIPSLIARADYLCRHERSL